MNNEIKEFEYPVLVHWEDTDAQGVVYHANYIKFMERARSDVIRRLGLVQRDMAEKGAMIVVAELSIKYRRAARLEDRLTVKTRLVQLRRASMVLEQDIWCGDVLLTRGMVKAAFVNSSTFAPIAVPDYVYEKFSPCVVTDSADA